MWLAACGWRAEGELLANAQKMVFIAAPHTSNWDLPFMLAVAWTLRIPVTWMGKHTLFGPPLGGLMRALGGIPVDRRSSQGLVAQMAQEFEKRERMALVIPPEGTRGRRDHWKSGFYRIAQAAGVPIVCGFLDYQQKCGGIGPIIEPTDLDADMARFADFYRAAMAKVPENFGPVRLADKPPQEAE